MIERVSDQFELIAVGLFGLAGVGPGGESGRSGEVVEGCLVEDGDSWLALYRYGFTNGPAFGDYRASAFNQFLHLDL